MGLHESSKGYKNIEDMLSIEDSCWRFLILLEKLSLVTNSTVFKSYKPSESPPFREIVSCWYTLYLDMCEAGAFDHD